MARIQRSQLCTPGMGVNLWNKSPLYVNPVNVFSPLAKVLADGQKRHIRLKSPGKPAPLDKTPDSGDRVNAAVV